MRERLVEQARAEGIDLRQSYVRVGKHLLFQQSRYAHAKQFKRARRETRKLRTLLGRVLRASGMNFAKLLTGLRSIEALLSPILAWLLEALQPPVSAPTRLTPA